MQQRYFNPPSLCYLRTLSVLMMTSKDFISQDDTNMLLFHPRNIHVFQNFTAEILRSIFKKSTPGFQIIQKMDQYALQLKL